MEGVADRIKLEALFTVSIYKVIRISFGIFSIKSSIVWTEIGRLVEERFIRKQENNKQRHPQINSFIFI
jgi:hypothetical protein